MKKAQEDVEILKKVFDDELEKAFKSKLDCDIYIKTQELYIMRLNYQLNNKRLNHKIRKDTKKKIENESKERLKLETNIKDALNEHEDIDFQ